VWGGAGTGGRASASASVWFKPSLIFFAARLSRRCVRVPPSVAAYGGELSRCISACGMCSTRDISARPAQNVPISRGREGRAEHNNRGHSSSQGLPTPRSNIKRDSLGSFLFGECRENLLRNIPKPVWRPSAIISILKPPRLFLSITCLSRFVQDTLCFPSARTVPQSWSCTGPVTWVRWRSWGLPSSRVHHREKQPQSPSTPGSGAVHGRDRKPAPTNHIGQRERAVKPKLPIGYAASPEVKPSQAMQRNGSRGLKIDSSALLVFWHCCER
jgi:hypothetical protein